MWDLAVARDNTRARLAPLVPGPRSVEVGGLELMVITDRESIDGQEQREYD
jgi:hypothetical protein